MRGRVSLATVLTVLSPVLMVAVWWRWTTLGDSFFFPPLPEVLTSFRQEWLFARVATDLAATLRRCAIGYAVATVVGISAGVVLGLSRSLAGLVRPVVEFMRALPPPALLPFTIVAIGIDDRAKVFLIVLGSIWPILLNTIDGIRGVDPGLVDAARSYGADSRGLLVSVRMPAALPQVVAGMRSSLSIALILTIISELVATGEGIGFFIVQQQRTFQMDAMWGGMLMLGLVGISLNAAFSAAERRVLGWYHARAGLQEQS